MLLLSALRWGRARLVPEEEGQARDDSAGRDPEPEEIALSVPGLKARLRPMRGLKQDRSARIVIAGHGFVQNRRRGHYELAVEEPVARRMAVALDELSLAI